MEKVVAFETGGRSLEGKRSSFHPREGCKGERSCQLLSTPPPRPRGALQAGTVYLMKRFLDFT
jgi:hypothetical protein